MIPHSAHGIILKADVESAHDVEGGRHIASGLHRVTEGADNEADAAHRVHDGGRLRHVAGSQHGDSGRVEGDHSEPAPVGDDLGNGTAQGMTANIDEGIVQVRARIRFTFRKICGVHAGAELRVGDEVHRLRRATETDHGDVTLYKGGRLKAIQPSPRGMEILAYPTRNWRVYAVIDSRGQ